MCRRPQDADCASATGHVGTPLAAVFEMTGAATARPGTGVSGTAPSSAPEPGMASVRVQCRTDAAGPAVRLQHVPGSGLAWTSS